MKEYEYIAGALEGYLCDQLTSIICSENYRNRSYEHGYRELFAEYGRLHKAFESDKEKFCDVNVEQSAVKDFQNRCREKREDIQNRFLKDIQSCTDIDVKSYADAYLKKLDEEEFKTTAKRICFYPYMVSVLRENNRGGCSDDKKF